MKIIHGIEAVEPPIERSVLTVGNFDGVHLGHQKLLAQAGLFAAGTGGPVVVLTFEPHPLTVVAPKNAPPRLSGEQEKLRLLERGGADIAVVAVSEPQLLGLEPEAFVDQVILGRFNPTHVVEGPSFGFGKGRRGTPEMLKQLAEPRGCEVHILDAVRLQIEENETILVSSSLIRRLLSQGKVRRASLCLGRPYGLFGRVVRGHGRGREIGFPTANVAVENQLIPGEGVYAGAVCVGESKRLSAISIGKTPTFGAGGLQVEAHLLDFDGDLYDETIRVDFHRKLRDQQKFDSPDALAEQLRRDVLAVRGSDAAIPSARDEQEPAT